MIQTAVRSLVQARQRPLTLSLRYASSKPHSKVLTTETMHPLVRQMEYAVRGALPIRAEALQKELLTDKTKGFDKVVFCNIGNPQQLNQKPITFFRQVASLAENPELLTPSNREALLKLYPADAIARAEVLLKHIGSVGAYSHSKGIHHIRENVAKFIERRDGFPAEPENIFLTQGASSGVQTVIQILTQNSKSGFMIPIPQYPLYSATLSLVGATPVPYYLEESHNWGLNVDELKEAVHKARADGTDVRALVIINPGNPTGQCLSEENMREIIDFCHNERLVLLADEVYQTNIYKPKAAPSTASKRFSNPWAKKLFSFHSISKGMIGECGRRGGYLECVNIDPKVMDQLYKIASVSLCPNVQGQIMVDLMTNPPKQGDESFEKYQGEIDSIYQSLIRRSNKLAQCFNSMENMTCNEAEGAMYLFPQLKIPQKAVDAAKEKSMAPDTFYCMAMLEATGVCVIPGSGFGQEPGTWHFRSTFLPEEHLFDKFCADLKGFHKKFMDTYKD
ncbi:PLP-dependent transferase [Hesseltinella vesiculosa]|uniref:Glutamate pyruvate transaminase n=1 Tax=Hesseltinella vesiculosa TaxID=101127 RepID=A0A1X2G6C1_9FUNG|nr:PLP-dependent transferase [Hesseltinella vesiculosa]